MESNDMKLNQTEKQQNKNTWNRMKQWNRTKQNTVNKQ